jgi:hypothetical protein
LIAEVTEHSSAIALCSTPRYMYFERRRRGAVIHFGNLADSYCRS